MTIKHILAAALVALSGPFAAAELSVAPQYSTHMVLQRDTPIVIRGSADPGDKVSVSLAGNNASATAGDDGVWRVYLDAMSAGGPHTISISAGDETLRLGDVLIGDVWVCSGQSNMFWRLSQTDRGDEFIQAAGNDQLRLLQIDKTFDRELRTVPETNGWREDTPDTASRFSAVGYHFGRLMHERTGVPVGLIHSSWGGTPLEAWTPMPVMTDRPDLFADRIKSLDEYDMPEAEANRQLEAAQKIHEDFATKALDEDPGLDNNWHAPSTDHSAWPTMPMRGYIDGELGPFNGVVWLRRTINLSDDWQGETAELRLGRIDDYDTVYINGTQVGETLWDQGDGRSIERRYDVPADLLRAGDNTIAIRLLDVRSSGGIVPDNRKFELFAPSVDRVQLEGDWHYKPGFDASDHGGFPYPARYAVPVGRSYRRPAVLYNAMIHPLTDYPIAGVIWYQGESNSGRGQEYADMFPRMINAWRDAWSKHTRMSDHDFPFLFVQLPNYRQRKDEPGESSWADLREAQRLTLQTTPNTGMAVTIDLGNPADIHPTNKLPVAERLADAAIELGESSSNASASSGPLPTGFQRRGDSIVITFAGASSLKTSDGSSSVKSVSIAGTDKNFRWADATIEGNTLVVRSDQVDQPMAVRYAWADNPEVNLIDQDGNPASPFQHHFDGQPTLGR